MLLSYRLSWNPQFGSLMRETEREKETKTDTKTERQRENRERKKRGLECGHRRAAEETQAPSEGSKGQRRLLFGVDGLELKGQAGWHPDG